MKVIVKVVIYPDDTPNQSLPLTQDEATFESPTAGTVRTFAQSAAGRLVTRQFTLLDAKGRRLR